MKLETWLKESIGKLAQIGIASGQLDCLLLLEDQLGKDRAWLLAHTETEISAADLKALNAKLNRRLGHEPMAYIRGFTEFYGRKFHIDKRVLEPRVESETMIELLLKQKLPANPTIVDVGTGSGAIAITTKLELPRAKVAATEIDKDALRVAKQNAEQFGVNIDFYTGNLLDPLPDPVDIILANLPYVPDKWQINEAAGMEPRIAIFGGSDGLDLYRQMFSQIDKLPRKPKLIFAECLPPQHEELAKIAATHGYRLKESRDFIQIFTTD